jgi:uncharacterized protein YdeI (YjbR/CyaY-like superfamily)
MATNPKVEKFFDEATQWPAELQRLRTILRDTPLTEDFKWRAPTYTYDDANILILGEYKDGCRVMFFEGALLEDPEGLLSAPGERSQHQRLLRYTDVDDIDEGVLRGFIDQSIANHEAGRKVEPTEAEAEPLPDELVAAFGEVDGLQAAFEALTPGRQRSWVIHISDAKKAETRLARVEKAVPRIFEGKGQLER